jgi:MYXO-CTERM domain-containing protein
MFLSALSTALAAPVPVGHAVVDPADVFRPFVERGMAGAVGGPGPGGDREPVAMAGSGARYLDVYRSGDLAILQDTDGEWLTEAFSNGADPNWILDSIQAAFYKKFDDDYQYMTILLVRDFGFFGAFYSPLANDVTGIGYDSTFPGEVFDTSDTQLDGFIFMNYAGYWAENPPLGRYVFGQEFMHRWGSFVNIDNTGLDPDALLGRDTAHWSYFLNTPNSPMEGNAWLDNGDGTWTTDNTAASTYSDLDLYLMGLVPPADVGEQTLLRVSDTDASAADVNAATTPEYLDRYGGGSDITLPATPLTFSLDDIISAEGPRVPSSDDSPKSFRMAFVVLVLSDDTFGDAEIAEVDSIRQSFEADWEEDVGYRADLDTTLGGGTAPTWGEPVDTGGGDDTAADTDTVDCCKEDAEPAGCGCAAGPTSADSGALALGALALAGLTFARRRGERV